MSRPLSTHERFSRMYAHQEADRVPIMDSPWSTTIDRWCEQGMPTRDYVSYFDLDRIGHIGVDNSPRYPEKILEETEDYVIRKTAWGVTLKIFKKHGSTPLFLDFTIVDFESWLEAKKRMTPDPSRVDWAYLEKNYPIWKKEERWITAGLWFGFDVTHSWMVGTERFLMAMLEDPDWCRDMYETHLELDLKLLDMVWDRGYRFDEINWPDDMGYKEHQFFSLKTYREMDKPFHKRAVDWAHEKGVKVRMHSCGDIRPFVPELVEIGIDGLNPLEVKAGMDPIRLKQQYGDKLVFHGGINAVLWDKPDEIRAEIERVVPVMKENGGYIFASDHSIPDNISFENFKNVLDAIKTAGKY